MKFARYLGLLLIFAVLVAPAASVRAADVAPTQKIETFYAALTDAMKQGSGLGMRGRYQLLAPAVDAAFDIPTMVKFIVGADWATMSDADHKAIADAFRRMTIANYANNFSTYEGQRFTIDPTVQTKAGDSFVQTNLVPKDGAPIPFNYRLRLTPDGWRVIDIYLNGYVSELATRRSDFASTLASGGASALVKKLNSLADNQMGGAKTGGE